ncbi:hypothetical protein RDV89_00235 [Nocardioides zeae]|uniref:Zinc transporter n=1 Tax=Nocardioides imazamoxiresistens TaxID=3231893 RepID=A0ABU3PQH7_9ACTN|nr:hypothetical protein [Nocardioides zeae]MDT9591472.1 hypothetical protein [Nocardioides zeae]
MLPAVVMVVVSAALIVGAAWGVFGRLSDRTEGVVVALAGGALMVSAVLELIEPATRQTSVWVGCAAVLVGAVVFTVADHLVKQRWGRDSGGGLLAAITLDGVPENLALGVALIGTGPLGAAALSGSILLSNLPEAAGGARDMVEDGRSRRAVMGLWTATAVLLALAALAGNLLLAGVPDDVLAVVRCFAAGAVVGSLATEVFPKSYREGGYRTGLAVAVGVVVAVLLSSVS